MVDFKIARSPADVHRFEAEGYHIVTISHYTTGDCQTYRMEKSDKESV